MNNSKIPQSLEKIKSNHIAFIGLGSNLENPILQINQALAHLAGLPEICLLKQSSLYSSAPIDAPNQPDYINAVVKVKTSLQPQALLAQLLAIEENSGRIRTYPNAARILDLDLLLYDNLQYREKNLIVPHPRMHQRAFVLRPLVEIENDSVIPGIGLASELLNQCNQQKLERLT
ncbi:MAG: 2-amino-4-hydroxy-6-hydroxymethyldihydropteridine diphosphokinase [Nitrosomonas sp.]